MSFFWLTTLLAIQGDVQIRNVRLHHFPGNTTVHIQPMDAGIIKCFMTYYRKQLVKHYIVCTEHNEAQTVNVRQALHMVKTAWDSVPQATISKCFNHMKIFPTTNDTNATTTNDEDDLPLNELQKLVRQLTD